MFAQELAVSFLKDTTATVFYQGLDVSEKMVELARAPRKRSVAALPMKVPDRSTARGSVTVSLPDEHDRTHRRRPAERQGRGFHTSLGPRPRNPPRKQASAESAIHPKPSSAQIRPCCSRLGKLTFMLSSAKRPSPVAGLERADKHPIDEQPYIRYLE